MPLEYEALDMNEIMNEAKRIAEEPGANQSNSDYLEKFVRLPERDGYVLLRILPRKKGTTLPWCATRVHTLNNPTTRQKKTFHCPRNLVKNERGQDQWKGECIICTFLADLWQRSDKTTGKEQEDLRNQYRQMKAVERYYYNVIVRSEKDKDGIVKSNVGPKIYSCGKTVHAKIVRAMLGDKTAGEKPLGDICHPTTGRDFRVVKKVVKGGGGEEYPNYDNSKFEDESPAGSIDQLGKWVENLHDLHALRAIKTQDELRHALKVHLGVIKEGEAASGKDDLSEFRSKGSSEPKVAVPQILREELAVSTNAASSSKEEKNSEEVLADDDFMKELNGM
jgi:hypothetical protein